MEPHLSSRRFQSIALPVVLGGLLGCADANGPTVGPCTGPVTLTATSTSGPEPSFAWTPNCLVDQVMVEEEIAPSAGGPQPRWIIQAWAAGHGARSPLRYGHFPKSMKVVLSAASLVAGHQYGVRVYAGSLEIGFAVFRP